MALPLGTDLEYLGENASGGMTVGTAASKLVGFHGSAVSQAAVCTVVPTSATMYSGSTADFLTLVTTINAMRTALINKGIMASS
jgi:hypothetical protein